MSYQCAIGAFDLRVALLTPAQDAFAVAEFAIQAAQAAQAADSGQIITG